MLTAERARELFRYDPESGALVWRVRTANCVQVGDSAGSCQRNVSGGVYLLVRVDRKLYKAHRVIWLLVTGGWPEGDIDHIDGDGLNNRWSNLRDVDPTENNQNARRRSDNTSGCTGVSWHAARGKWAVRINNGKERAYLGLHDTFKEAVSYRQLAEEILGYHPNHGRGAA